MFDNIFFYLSSCVVLLIILGLYFRRKRIVHITLMTSALVLDFLTTLAIEINRHAVEKVVAHQVSTFTLVHAGVSVVVLLLYVVMAVLGIMIIRRKMHAREWHKRLAIVFVGLRLFNFVSSFYVGTI